VSEAGPNPTKDLHRQMNDTVGQSYVRKAGFSAIMGTSQLKNRPSWSTAGRPISHVDTEKRELIGLFKNLDTSWCRDPHRVNVYLENRKLLFYNAFKPRYGIKPYGYMAQVARLKTSKTSPAVAVRA
jgi:hypothetical protein